MIDPKRVCKAVDAAQETLAWNAKTIDFLEGNLEPYVLKALERQLSPRVFAYAKERMVPINIMPRYIEKLSNIYQTGVLREVQDGDEADKELLGWYTNQMDVNTTMHMANKLYNACGASLVHPYATPEYGPCLRVIPNDRFVVVSDDLIHPTKPTMVILLAGKDERDRKIYWAYTDEEFAVIRSDETVDFLAMERMGIPDGVNPYGVLPFIYTNSSQLKLWPTPDRDTVRMTEFVPVALTDLNLAAMFSSFSITYITNGNVENLTYAPNALWFLKSDDPEKDVQLGSLKPEVDYQEVLNLIQSELSLWMGSKGIKSASVGNLTVENSASGIAKLIDEADTFDVRQLQTVTFSRSEQEMWELILRYMHPVWVAQGIVTNRGLLSSEAVVKTRFTIMPAGTARTQVIADQKAEYEAGFTTRVRAISALNPHMTEQEVEDLIEDIMEEKQARSVNNGDQAPEDQNRAARADIGSYEEGGDSRPSDREDSGENGQGQG